MTGFYLAGWQFAVTLITHDAWVEAELAQQLGPAEGLYLDKKTRGKLSFPRAGLKGE